LILHRDDRKGSPAPLQIKGSAAVLRSLLLFFGNDEECVMVKPKKKYSKADLVLNIL
jgi:hypothetical protein